MNKGERMKKTTTFLILAALLAGVSGCETLPKKFIRKKKEPAYRPSTVLLDEGPYQKQYSNEYYYKQHFTLWRTWHSELITQLGGNHRQVARAAQESLGHMQDMNRYLKPERQTEMAPLLEEMGKITKRIEAGTYSKTDALAMRSDIERVQRQVASNFYYDKIKQDLIEDTVTA
jgi:hypothetical protein